LEKMRGSMRIPSGRPCGAFLLIALAIAAPLAVQGAKPAAVAVFELAPAGNEARYRVKEQLVGVDLPGEAVGVTSDITKR
jgi:hypothetical protein